MACENTVTVDGDSDIVVTEGVANVVTCDGSSTITSNCSSSIVTKGQESSLVSTNQEAEILTFPTQESIVTDNTKTEIINSASQGPAGVGADRHFPFTQNVSSDTWSITHNLAKFPSVTIVDTGGNEVTGEVEHIDNNNLIVKFSAEFTGTAYLN